MTAAAVSIFGIAQAQPKIETLADFAVIMDYETGEFLFEKNAHERTAPASMSKLMTVAIVFEKLKAGEISLDDEFSVSEKAWRMGGSKMWVRVDTKIRLDDLLRGIIIQSGNDACIVVAENIAGTEEAFAELMNRKAREWGLTDSTFANATGWPDENQKMSTADLAKLARKIIRDYPEYYSFYNEREFTWEKITQANRNPILDAFPGADGLKTGHTEESGYGLVASARNDGQRRIVVMNGLESERERATESQRLLRIAFNDFVDKEIYKEGAIVGDALVFGGKSPTVPLTVKEDIDFLLYRTDADAVKSTVIYEGPVKAPIRAGQEIGYLRIETSGRTREFPLFAKEAVRTLGVFGRIGFAAKSLLAKPESQNIDAASSEAGAQ